jgi:hypothetical protein
MKRAKKRPVAHSCISNATIKHPRGLPTSVVTFARYGRGGGHPDPPPGLWRQRISQSTLHRRTGASFPTRLASPSSDLASHLEGAGGGRHELRAHGGPGHAVGWAGLPRRAGAGGRKREAARTPPYLQKDCELWGREGWKGEREEGFTACMQSEIFASRNVPPGHAAQSPASPLLCGQARRRHLIHAWLLACGRATLAAASCGGSKRRRRPPRLHA